MNETSGQLGVLSQRDEQRLKGSGGGEGEESGPRLKKHKKNTLAPLVEKYFLFRMTKIEPRAEQQEENDV